MAEFALGHPDKAVELLGRAMEFTPENDYFAGPLAAAYGELGLTEQAKAAYAVFGRTFVSPPPSLAWVMADLPFSDRGVSDRFANGFRVAGALDFGYLPLLTMNKLGGPEIRSLLFGRKISGRDFWDEAKVWRQQRTDDGTVEHSGYPFHAGISADTGIGRIVDDMLCETWPKLTVEVCVVFFAFQRVPLAIGGESM